MEFGWKGLAGDYGAKNIRVNLLNTYCSIIQESGSIVILVLVGANYLFFTSLLPILKNSL